MSTIVKLAAPSVSAPPEDVAHNPGDVVLVIGSEGTYYARVVATTWNGSYVLHPVEPVAAVGELRAA